MLLLFGGRPDRLEIILNERAVFPWNAVLIQELLLSGTELRCNVSIIEFGAFLLAHFLDILFFPFILHAFDTLLLEFDIQPCGGLLPRSTPAAFARRGQTLALGRSQPWRGS